MEAKIKEIIEKYGLLDRVSIVAVSGGVDSVVLLHLLQKLIPNKHLVVAHLNHGLRRASKDEARMVKTLAEHSGLRYYEKELRLKSKDEARARQARYRWLRELKLEVGADYIITAHHLDDQVETILLNLVRGVGPLEIWGMAELDNDLLRPLLTFSKEEIRDFARKHRLQFCEDESNKDTKYTRNQIRHNVIPELRAMAPKLDSVIKREIDLGREAKDYLEQQTKQFQRRLVNSNSIDLERLRKLHPFLQKELIKRMLLEVTGREGDIYQKNVQAVLGLLDREGSKVTEIGGVRIEKTYRELIFDASRPKVSRSKKLGYGENEFNSFTITVRRGQGVPGPKMILLPESFSDNLRVRTWRAGDRIKASFGTKKVQDVFVDAKIDRRERSGWPIITHREEIIWIPGLLAAKIDSKSKKIIVEVK